MKFPIVTLLTLATLCVGVSGSAADGSPEHSEPVATYRPVVDFTDEDEVSRWFSVDDGVMGGISRSAMSAATGSTAVFLGELSLENNGGFASVRRGVPGLAGDAVALEVMGDGRTYQFRIRADDRFDGVAYRASFDTVADEWIRVEIAPESFVPTFRGRFVPGAPPLAFENARQISFLIADKREGGFWLRVRSIGMRIDPEAAPSG